MSKFACGPPTDHECNSEKFVLLLSEEPYEVEETEENREKYKEIINGGSVACSICGTSAYSLAGWIDF